jgi:hypothetical protein
MHSLEQLLLLLSDRIRRETGDEDLARPIREGTVFWSD